MKNEFVGISNDQLLAKTTETVKLEKFYAARLIRYLLEVENRALHLLLGYETHMTAKPTCEFIVKAAVAVKKEHKNGEVCTYSDENMFKFLTKELKFSDSEAYIRTNAMKLLKANPIVENKIVDGSLSLTVASEVQKLIKEEKKNDDKKVIDLNDILAKVAGKSVNESKTILDGHRSVVKDKKYKIELDEETWKKLQEIKKERASTARDEVIIKKLIEENYHKIQKKKITPKEEKTVITSNNSRYIPLQTKKHLLKDSDYRCQYVSPITGKRCECTVNISVDHCNPFGLGGSNHITNLRNYCFGHNYLYARDIYGADKIDGYRR